MSLTPDERKRVEDAFEHALELEPERRDAWIESLGDLVLADRVRALLAAHARAGGVLDPPGTEQGVDPTDTSLRVGPYRLLHRLGSGGMGDVWLARREDAFMRRVAVKMVRADLSSEEALGRFHTERQIMASLGHANIAQLLDGGLSDGGRPFLVMEFVDGLPVTDYCDREGLSVADRLDLFRKVCDAVQYAHRNLVIHRDLKPSNILVTMEGEPKLLDFGIAKLAAPYGSVDRHSTNPGGVGALTPSYASPEQLRGEPLTTASDVYALGVLLYELLTGHRPFEDVSPARFFEAVCERDPDPPSTLLDTEAARGVRGDLDAIVLTALRKEPGRRYESVAHLSADVGAHLDGRPVAARGDRRGYRVAKFARRYRGQVAVAALALTALVSGLAVASWQAGIARAERDRAAGALERAQATADFLVALYESAAATEATGDSLSARTMLSRGVERIDELRAVPALQARLLHTLADAYRNMGAYADAERALQRADSLHRTVLTTEGGGDAREWAAVRADLADVYRLEGRFPEARDLARQALADRRRSLGPNDPDVATSLTQLGGLAVYFGDLEAADSLMRRALELRLRVLEPDDPVRANALDGLAAVVRRRGQVDEAEALLRESLAFRREVQGPDSRDHAIAMDRLASLLTEDRGQDAEAEGLYRRALAIFGDDDPERASALADLSEVLAKQGRFEEALDAARAATDLRRDRYGDRNDGVASALHGEATVLYQSGALEDAERIEREALTIWSDVLGPEHVMTAYALCGLADILVAEGRADEAEVAARRALAIRSDGLAEENLLIPAARAVLGSVLAARGQPVEGESILLESLDAFSSRLPAWHTDVRAVHDRLAVLYEEWGREEEAARHRAAAGGPPPRDG